MMDEKWNSEEQKENAAKIIVSAINKISQSNHNLNRGIEGALELRFFGPTFHFIPCRDKQSYQYKQEILKRQKSFENKKWDQLQNRIDYEQDKRNQKKERKYLRENNQNNDILQNINSIRNEDEEKKICDNPIPINNNQNKNKNNNKNTNNQQGLQNNPSQTTETDIGIHLNELIQNIDDYKYDENDDVESIKKRIRRCLKYAKLNKFKKADNALNPTKIADLNKPELWHSLLSKYPNENALNINDNNTIQPRYNLDRDDIIKIMTNLNKHACGGPGGIVNELIIWMAQKEGDYDIGTAMNNLSRTHIRYGLPIQIRKLLMYASGIAILKEKKNDVRPICIIPSIVRLLDKIAVENIPPNIRREALGPYQMVDTREGCEIGTIVADYAADLINTITGEVMVNADISNAFNSINRQKQFGLMIEKLPDLYIILYFIQR